MLKRVFYSAYIPINKDNLLPSLKQPPLVRENRLYQADWLLRYYNFKVADLLYYLVEYDALKDNKLNLKEI